MGSVTGLTADRMLAIEGDCIVDAEIQGDDLILIKQDGTSVNVGNVRGPMGASYVSTSDVGFPAAAAAASTAVVVIDRFTINAVPYARQFDLVSSVYATVSVAATQLNYIAYLDAGIVGYARVNFATISVPDQVVVVGRGDIAANASAVIETRLSRQAGTGTFTTSTSSFLTRTNLRISAA